MTRSKEQKRRNHNSKSLHQSKSSSSANSGKALDSKNSSKKKFNPISNRKSNDTDEDESEDGNDEDQHLADDEDDQFFILSNSSRRQKRRLPPSSSSVMDEDGDGEVRRKSKGKVKETIDLCSSDGPSTDAPFIDANDQQEDDGSEEEEDGSEEEDDENEEEEGYGEEEEEEKEEEEEEEGEATGNVQDEVLFSTDDENEFGRYTKADEAAHIPTLIRSLENSERSDSSENPNGQFTIKKIIRCRKHPRRATEFWQYRVSWDNYTEYENLWITYKDIDSDNRRSTIDKFWRESGTERPETSRLPYEKKLSDHEADIDSDDTIYQIRYGNDQEKEEAKQKLIKDLRKDRYKSRNEPLKDLKSNERSNPTIVASVVVDLHSTDRNESSSYSEEDSSSSIDDDQDDLTMMVNDDASNEEAFQQASVPISPSSPNGKNKRSPARSSITLNDTDSSSSEQGDSSTNSSNEDDTGSYNDDDSYDPLERPNSASPRLPSQKINVNIKKFVESIPEEELRLQYSRSYITEPAGGKRREVQGRTGNHSTSNEIGPIASSSNGQQGSDVEISTNTDGSTSNFSYIGAHKSLGSKIVVIHGPKQIEEPKVKRNRLFTGQNKMTKIGQIASSSRDRIEPKIINNGNLEKVSHQMPSINESSVNTNISQKIKDLNAQQEQTSGWDDNDDLPTISTAFDEQSEADAKMVNGVLAGWDTDMSNGMPASAIGESNLITGRIIELPVEQRQKSSKRTHTGWSDEEEEGQINSPNAPPTKMPKLDMKAADTVRIKEVVPENRIIEGRHRTSESDVNNSMKNMQIASPTGWRRSGPLPTQMEYKRQNISNNHHKEADSGIGMTSMDSDGRSLGYSDSRGSISPIQERRSSTQSGEMDAEQVKKWAEQCNWPAKVIEEIPKSYHWVLKQKGMKDCDEDRHSLIGFIRLLKGGHRETKEDLLKVLQKEGNRVCIWLGKPSAPLSEIERLALSSTNNVNFIDYQNLQEMELIRPVNGDKVTMYSMGALVAKMIEFCKASRLPVEEERKLGMDVFGMSNGGQGSQQRVFLHPWQRSALTSLIKADRLKEFLQEILKIRDNADNYALMLLENDLIPLEDLPECEIQYTIGPQYEPAEEPNEVEMIPKDLKEFVRTMDDEIHKTLKHMQRHRITARSITFAIAGCEIEPAEIATCYSRIDVPQ